MQKPKILQKIDFDFSYDYKKLWRLRNPATDMFIEELTWHLDYPFWDIEGTDDWNLTPREVIDNPQKHGLHYGICLKADLNHPIEIMRNKGKWQILDGLHRLVKAYIENQKTVKVRIIKRSQIKDIKKSIMKIPKEAKRVFKGEIFEVYQWQQKMFDGSYSTYEALKRPDTVQVIATKGEKVLIGYEKQPTEGPLFSLFGGKQEEGEELLEAAKRELLEETGMESADWELIKAYEPMGKIEWTIHVFVARDCRKVAEPNLDSGEDIQVKEMDFDEFVDVVISEDFWGDDVSNDFFRMKCDGAKLEELRKKIFKEKI